MRAEGKRGEGQPSRELACWGGTMSYHVQMLVGRWGSRAMKLLSGDLHSQQVTGGVCIRHFPNFSSNQQLPGEAWSDTFGEICHISMCNDDILISEQQRGQRLDTNRAPGNPLERFTLSCPGWFSEADLRAMMSRSGALTTRSCWALAMQLNGGVLAESVKTHTRLYRLDAIK